MEKSATHNQLLIQLADGLITMATEIRMHYGTNYVCVTPALDNVITITGRLGTVNLKHIATVLSITSGAATQHISALEKLGAVSRVANTNDRREVMIELTLVGHDLYATIRRNKLKVYGEIFSDFSEEELQTFINLIDKVSPKN